MGRTRAVAGAPGPRLDLLVVGHTNLDHFLRVDELPRPDRTVPVVERETRLGGTAANLALSAAGWGVATGLHSFVGPDFPDEFAARLGRAGVDIAGLVRVPGARSPACYIAVDGRGGQMTLIDQGPMENASARALPDSLLREAGWVHVTTGDPGYQIRLARKVREIGGHVAADPAQEIHYRWDRRHLAMFLNSAEILFGNSAEIRKAASLLGVRDTAALLARVPLIIETRGVRGATAHTRRGTVHVAGVRPRRIRSIVGAGDAFRGGFYAGWFAGQELEGCLRAGVRSASRWIEGGAAPTARRRLAR